MTEAMEFIAHTVRSGGPDERDFSLLNDSFRSVLRDAVLPARKAEVRSMVASAMGDAYTAQTVQGLVYQHPQGVDVDFEVMERTYSRYLSPCERFRKWDSYWQQHAFAEAARYQKTLMKLWIRKKENEQTGVSVMDAGCGSSRALYEYLLENRSLSTFTCLDTDQSAIDYAKLMCRNFRHQVGLHCCDFMRFNTDHRYDLVWSFGVFERLNDAQFKAGLKKLVSITRPGSTIVLGNVGTSNPSQDYMDLLGWSVTPRSASHVRYLAMSCELDFAELNVEPDEWGVNNYLTIEVGTSCNKRGGQKLSN